MFKLPALPYAKNALSPFLNEEQMTFHYDKHHKAYIDNLNKAMETDKSLEGKSLEEIVLSSSGPNFNNSAQAWNHTFFWHCMAPAGKGGKASAELTAAITKDFSSMDELKTKFVEGGVKTFGSGWIWLCADKDNKLSLVSTSNAAVPFKDSNLRPILVCDVWEHAYYVDYRNARQKFLETFWGNVNWEYASQNFASPKVRDCGSEMKA